jgi:ribosomal protein L36
MKAKPNGSQFELMQKYQVTPRYVYGRPKGSDKPAQRVCELVDRDGKVCVYGEHPGDFQMALDDAVNKLTPDNRPRTPGVLVEENAALRAKIAELEKSQTTQQAADKPAAKSPRPATPKAD